MILSQAINGGLGIPAKCDMEGIKHSHSRFSCVKPFFGLSKVPAIHTALFVSPSVPVVLPVACVPQSPSIALVFDVLPVDNSQYIMDALENEIAVAIAHAR